MPRREGDVLRRGTAIVKTPIEARANSSCTGENGERGSYTQSCRNASAFPGGYRGIALGILRPRRADFAILNEMDSTGSRMIRGAGEGHSLDDPRSGNAALHDFHEILAIAMCAVLCGGQGSVDMGLFAKAKEPFLRGFLKLENGVPSHDTFSRLFRMLDPEQFRAAFQRFMAGFSEPCE